MDPDLLAEELAACQKRGKLPKAVVPTEIYGQCVDLDRNKKICRKYGIPVIVDAAEALGIPVRVVQTIEKVESAGKADAIRFEPHVFLRKRMPV